MAINYPPSTLPWISRIGRISEITLPWIENWENFGNNSTMRAKRAKNFGGILAVLQGEIVKKGVQNGGPYWSDFLEITLP